MKPQWIWTCATVAVLALVAGAQLGLAQQKSDGPARAVKLKAVADARAAVIKAEDEKAALETAVQQKAAALKTATAALTAAKAAATKAAQGETTAARAAAEKAAAAQAAADRAAADRAAAEQALAQKDQAINAALARVAEAKADAYGGLKPIPETAWNCARARHLLFRAGFGGTPEEVARLHAMGLHRAVQHLVAYQQIPPPDIPFTAQPPERPEPYERTLPPAEQNSLNARRQRIENLQVQGIRHWWLKRMTESPRPLEEKLTLFWHGHFASEYETLQHSYFMFVQNQMFRTHANGNFGALLHGLVHDPAMLRYLNNDTNVKGRPNENLAREIMELFALGLDQGYTEFDIREAAKALTGYSYDHWSGQFRFREARHEHGPKTIFGKTGPWTGDDLVELLLQQPHTARFLARKLFVFFAHEHPDEATVDRLAGVLRANNYELAPLLENLFLSEEFYGERAVGTQIKGPVQLMIGALRELGIKDANYAQLAQATRAMGQDLLQPPNVKGWDGGRTWINANRVFLRYNATVELLESFPRSDGRRGVDVIGTVLAGKSFQSAEDVVDHLVRCCLAVPLSPSKRQSLIEYVRALPPPAEWEKRREEVNARLTGLLALLMSSPEYQLT